MRPTKAQLEKLLSRALTRERKILKELQAAEKELAEVARAIQPGSIGYIKGSLGKIVEAMRIKTENLESRIRRYDGCRSSFF